MARKPQTDADRQRARRARLTKSGGRILRAALTPAAAKRLRAITATSGETETAAVNRLIEQA